MAASVLRCCALAISAALASGLWATSLGRLGADTAAPTAAVVEAVALDPATELVVAVSNSTSVAVTVKEVVPPTQDRSLVALVPSEKLAYCTIYMTGKVVPVFDRINGATPEDPYGLSFFASMTSRGQSFSDVSRENGWRFAAFVRDPLERYLALFMEHCLVETPVPGAEYCHVLAPAANATLEEKVALFETQARQDLVTGLPQSDRWLPQYRWMTQYRSLTQFCGLDKFSPVGLDYLGEFSSVAPVMNERVQDMLKTTTSMTEVASLTSSFFLQTPAEEAPPLHDYYRNPEVIKAVLSLVREDYEQFHLEVPDFARWYY